MEFLISLRVLACRASRRGTTLALVGHFLVKLEDDDIRVPIFGMNRVVAILRCILILSLAATNLHDLERTVLLAPLLDQINCVREPADEGCVDHSGSTARPVAVARQSGVPPQGRRGGRRLRPPCGHVTSAHPPFVCMWKDKGGITSLRLCFPQEQLKRSHCATRLCPCGGGAG